MKEPYGKESSESILASSLAGGTARSRLKRRQDHKRIDGTLFCRANHSLPLREHMAPVDQRELMVEQQRSAVSTRQSADQIDLLFHPILVLPRKGVCILRVRIFLDMTFERISRPARISRLSRAAVRAERYLSLTAHPFATANGTDSDPPIRYPHPVCRKQPKPNPRSHSTTLRAGSSASLRTTRRRLGTPTTDATRP